MTRKRTVRREYLLVNPITHAAHQASKLSLEEWNVQILPVQIAVDCLSRGDWNRDTWQPLFECLNRIESLTKLNHVDAKDFIDRAQAAMADPLDRMEKTGARAFKHNELSTIREILQVYGDLLKEASHRQFAEACRHTNANVNRILRNRDRMQVVKGCVFERQAA